MACLNFFGQNIFFFVQIALCLHLISTIQTIGLNVQKSAGTELTKQRVSMTSVRHPLKGCLYLVNQATSKLHYLSEKERQPQNHYRLPIMNIASFHYESKKTVHSNQPRVRQKGSTLLLFNEGLCGTIPAVS